MTERTEKLRRRALFAALLLLFASATFAQAASGAAPGAVSSAASVVDLGLLDLHVRSDFRLEWSYYEPDPADPAWTRLPADPGRRIASIRDLKLPGEPERSFWDVLPGRARKYCIVATFDAAPELLESSSGVGLYLQEVGRNWEVYLNGSILRSEVYLSRDGRIERERAVHGALVPVDKRYLKEGKNVLAIAIYGTPGDFRNGLFSTGPYLIGDYQSLLALKAEYLDLMLIGIYFFFAVYHVILFALRPANTPYLLHGLGTLAFALYLFSRSYIVFDVVSDTAIIRGLELSSIFLVFPLFLAFFDLCNRGRTTLFTWIYGGVCLLFALLAPIVAGEQLLFVWRLSAPLALLYLLAADVVLPLRDAFRAAGRSDAGAPPAARLKAFLSASNFWTVAIAAAIVLLAAVAAAVGFNSKGAFTAAKYGGFLLILGSAAVLASQFTRVYRQVEELNAGLEAKVRDRTAALADAMEEQAGLNENLAAANRRLQSALDVAAKDMRIAVQVQQGFFPQHPPALADWDIAFAYLPAQGVSGDFYDFYVDEGKLEGLVVGDVSGHGVSSGLITVLARSVFYRNSRALRGHSLGRVIEEVNVELSKELSAVENYLTAIFLRFDGNSVEYANAAHPELAFRRAGRARASYVVPPSDDYRGPPLGREGIEAPYRALKFEVGSGDSLFAYTDCLLESRDVDGHPFGSEGLISAYGRAPDGTASEMLQYIMEDWRFHVRGASVADDLTA
ncbi:MAG: SpoIIE family protein phosphatase, partial [Spirochaetaceae bacterium]|nr:SpoIIE family protein phosphatase [Spirochaetaceae bacterium]